MPHRLVYLWGGVKLVGGVAGVVGSVIASLPYAVVDPDHIKMLILAVGGGSVAVVYLAMKELVPAVIGARMQWHEMNRKMAESDRKNKEEIEKVRQEVDALRAAAVADARRIKAEALAEARRIEKDAADKRHDLRDDVNAQLLELREENEALKRRLGLTGNTVDTVIDTVQEIADKMDPPVIVDVPHLEATPDRP